MWVHGEERYLYNCVNLKPPQRTLFRLYFPNLFNPLKNNKYNNRCNRCVCVCVCVVFVKKYALMHFMCSRTKNLIFYIGILIPFSILWVIVECSFHIFVLECLLCKFAGTRIRFDDLPLYLVRIQLVHNLIWWVGWPRNFFFLMGFVENRWVHKLYVKFLLVDHFSVNLEPFFNDFE